MDYLNDKANCCLDGKILASSLSIWWDKRLAMPFVVLARPHLDRTHSDARNLLSLSRPCSMFDYLSRAPRQPAPSSSRLIQPVSIGFASYGDFWRRRGRDNKLQKNLPKFILDSKQYALGLDFLHSDMMSKGEITSCNQLHFLQNAGEVYWLYTEVSRQGLLLALKH